MRSTLACGCTLINDYYESALVWPFYLSGQGAFVSDNVLWAKIVFNAAN